MVYGPGAPAIVFLAAARIGDESKQSAIFELGVSSVFLGERCLPRQIRANRRQAARLNMQRRASGRSAARLLNWPAEIRSRATHEVLLEKLP